MFDPITGKYKDIIQQKPEFQRKPEDPSAEAYRERVLPEIEKPLQKRVVDTNNHTSENKLIGDILAETPMWLSNALIDQTLEAGKGSFQWNGIRLFHSTQAYSDARGYRVLLKLYQENKRKVIIIAHFHRVLFRTVQRHSLLMPLRSSPMSLLLHLYLDCPICHVSYYNSHLTFYSVSTC